MKPRDSVSNEENSHKETNWVRDAVDKKLQVRDVPGEEGVREVNGKER